MRNRTIRGEVATNVIRFKDAIRKAELYDSVKEREDNVIGTRIQEARMRKGLSLSKFAELLSQYGLTVHRQGIGKWETGGSVPNAYQLIAICHALGIEEGISYFTRSPKGANELNRAGQEKLKAYREDLVASGLYKPTKQLKATPIRYIEMDISYLPASAGTGEYLDDGGFERLSFPEDSVPAGAEFGIRISGDSMEPVYHDGQIAWVSTCNIVPIGKVGIFILDGSGYIKMYNEKQPDPDTVKEYADSDGYYPNQPVLVSYNKAYPPIFVSPESDFRVVGRVLN